MEEHTQSSPMAKQTVLTLDHDSHKRARTG